MIYLFLNFIIPNQTCKIHKKTLKQQNHDGFYICCIDDVEQWTEDCTLWQTKKHDHGVGFVWPDLEDLKTSNQE